jgi:hypothetical protein
MPTLIFFTLLILPKTFKTGKTKCKHVEKIRVVTYIAFTKNLIR